MASALPRPRQVTIASWMIMAGSVALVLTAFQQVAGLHSMDTREAIERVLDEPPLDGLGVSVDQLLKAVRVLAMVAAACATATAILGWQILRRSKHARVALSFLAVPLFLSGIGTGGILSTAVAVGVGLLWMQPARDWFDGRWQPAPDRPAASATERPERAARPEHPDRSGPSQTPQQPRQPPPYAGWPAPQASPTPPPAAWPPPQGGWPPPGAPVPGAPAETRRPPAVLAAVVLTWVCSVLLGGLFVFGAAWLIVSPDTLMDEMAKQNPELVRDGTVTVSLLRAMLAVMAGVIVVWVVAACVVAFFVLRRAGWARILLLISSAAAGLGLLACSIINPLMVVPLAGAGVAVALLLRRDVRVWFSTRR